MKKGSRHTLQTRLKIAANVGSKRTAKTCENISKAKKRYWASKRLQRLQQPQQQEQGQQIIYE